MAARVEAAEVHLGDGQVERLAAEEALQGELHAVVTAAARVEEIVIAERHLDRGLGDEVPLARLAEQRVAGAEHGVADAVVGRLQDREAPLAQTRQHGEIVLHEQLAMVGVEAELIVEALDELVEDPVGVRQHREGGVSAPVPAEAVGRGEIEEAELAVDEIGLFVAVEEDLGVFRA